MFFPCKCPQCGGDLQIPENKDIVKCMYCSTDIKVREVITTTNTNIQNLQELADSAFKATNYEEAINFCNKFLEIDPANSQIWLTKGLSIGWLSNLREDHFNEMEICIRKAISIAKNEAESEVIRLFAAPSILLIAQALFSLSTKHTIQFISVPSANFEHIDRCKRIIKIAELTLEFDSTLEAANDLIIDICSRLYGVSSCNTDDKLYFKKKAHQYNYSGSNRENFKKFSDSSCFVITATMGNAENIFVYELRHFRDSFLIQTNIGMMFVVWYYSKGPVIAKFIGSNFILRVTSFFTLVMPAYIISKITRILKR